jgi:hypothetical protein
VGEVESEKEAIGIMAKKKNGVAGDKEKTGKKVRVKWIFPRHTLEQALKLAYAIKDLHGGNPWSRMNCARPQVQLLVMPTFI